MVHVLSFINRFGFVTPRVICHFDGVFDIRGGGHQINPSQISSIHFLQADLSNPPHKIDERQWLNPLLR